MQTILELHQLEEELGQQLRVVGRMGLMWLVGWEL